MRKLRNLGTLMGLFARARFVLPNGNPQAVTYFEAEALPDWLIDG